MIWRLTRHFFARMLDGEWSSTPGQWQSVVIGAVAAALPASLAMLSNGSGRQFAMVHEAQELALFTMLLSVSGLVALVQWQNLFPGRRDYLALAGLPIRPREIFLARFGAVSAFSILLVLCMNLLPAITSPPERSIAATVGCLSVFFGVVALQGVLLNVLPGKLFVRVSSVVQGVLIAALVLAGLYSWSIRDWGKPALARVQQFGWWAPPVWFVGLHERLAGVADPFYSQMAGCAMGFTVVAAAVTLACYVIGFRRYRRLLVEAPVHVAIPGRRTLLRVFVHDPRGDAVLQFLSKTLARSRTHRALWLAYIGGAIGVMFNSSIIDGGFFSRSHTLVKSIKFMVLFWPLSCTVVLLSGLRHVF